MKRLTLIFTVLCVSCGLGHAGPEQYSGKEMKQVAPPCTEWYSDTEWNLSAWGTYAFTGTTWSQSTKIELNASSGDQGSFDRYLGDDHAWGGGLDFKYFFHRYFGVGLEGFAVDAKQRGWDVDISQINDVFFIDKITEYRTVGSVLGTFTLRYPFHCSRFSPYVWAGGGGIFGGGDKDTFNASRDANSSLTVTTDHHGDTAEAMGQFGGGLEIRITRHIGVINDFSWNVINGPNNNFGMVRSGLNFSF